MSSHSRQAVSELHHQLCRADRLIFFKITWLQASIHHKNHHTISSSAGCNEVLGDSPHDPCNHVSFTPKREKEYKETPDYMMSIELQEAANTPTHTSYMLRRSYITRWWWSYVAYMKAHIHSVRCCTKATRYCLSMVTRDQHHQPEAS